MNARDASVDRLLHELQERAKELTCLYRVDEILSAREAPLEQLAPGILEAVAAAWQFPAAARAQLRVRGQDFRSPGLVETGWVQRAPIVVQGEAVGELSVHYLEAMPGADEGPFLKEERKLIDTLAGRIAHFLQHRELAALFAKGQPAEEQPDRGFRVVLDLLRHTDRSLFERVTRKMLNLVSVRGIQEAKALLAAVSAEPAPGETGDDNRPRGRGAGTDLDELAVRTFRLAADHLGEDELLASIQGWIKEDRVNFLVHALESSYTTLVEIANVVERFHRTGVDSRELSPATQVGLKVGLIRRLLSDDPGFIEACRGWAEIDDFFELLQRTVILPQSHGRLGGKSSGLFLAMQILRRSPGAADAVGPVLRPKTWYLPSDGIIQFVDLNNLDDVYNWRYRELGQIRQEYPHIIEVFKSSRFPPEVVNGLSAALDELGNRPLIVRSSSLLEDRTGAAFSGKYKSLFLANRGDKPRRLKALLEAVAEVYASVFGPDPIQYRAERGLLAHHEEMAVMIQEVVGRRVGRYFLPAFSGVGFSRNELRWSSRIRREDGLLRLVPGLGTRAVDRLADDYPVLAAPGQPGLRVNASPEEIRRYSPRKLDVINLEAGVFESIEVRRLLEETGGELGDLAPLISIEDHGRLRRPSPVEPRLDPRQVVFTLDGLLSDASFLGRMRSLLRILEGALGTPVDIEFASDGRDFYLVQCRPQSRGPEFLPAPIPRDLPRDKILFTARRHVSNGNVPDLTHVVYVDPDAYARLATLEEMREVGRAVSALNRVLPKRQFLLMGPGRWGSRGDIHLGVSVSYADISNAAVLAEVARRKGEYLPDLSFGTHFFQDLVESGIRYLPLYPDDPDVVFNEAFLLRAPNLLPRLLPEFAGLAPVLRVIDVPRATEGLVLRVLMNADLEEAVGLFAAPGATAVAVRSAGDRALPTEEHWRWRLQVSERLAAEADAGRFGIKGLFVFGSTKNATAGPGSDIDLIVHVDGDPERRLALELWLEGWSRCLAEVNYLRTGYRCDGLLDVHYVTDDDIARQSSYAAKIGAITDAARPLRLGATLRQGPREA